MGKQFKTKALLSSLIVILSFAYLINIGHLSLWDPDEPYYIEAAREMTERGDYITPYFNYEPRLNKPIFFYWCEIISAKLFGFNEFAARFPSLIAGFGFLFILFKIGEIQYRKETAFTALLIAATSIEVYVLSRQAVTDMCLAFFMSLALYGYLTVHIYGNKPGSRWYLFYIGTAFAVITKGPIGLFLPAAVVFIVIMMKKDLLILKSLNVIKGIIIFTIIAVPWYIAVLIQNGFKFFEEFIIQNNILRFFTPMYKHTGALWYYIPVIILGFFPWIILFFRSLITLLKSARQSRLQPKKKQDESSFALAFNIIWFLVFFIFFSLSGSKLPAYILGLFPPLALLTAAGLTSAKKQIGITFKIIHFLYLILFITAMSLLVRYAFFQSFYLVLFTISLLILSAVISYIAIKKIHIPYMTKDAQMIVIPAIVVVIVLILLSNFYLFPKINDYFPVPKLGSIVKMSGKDSTPVIAYRYYRQSMTFYCSRKVIFVQSLQELEKILQKNVPFFMFVTGHHWSELPDGYQKQFIVLGYGLRYRSKLDKAIHLFTKPTDKPFNRSLFLAFYRGIPMQKLK